MDSIRYLAGIKMIDGTNNAGNNITTDPQVLMHFTRGSVQIVWSSLTGTINGTIAIQGSNDGVNYDNLVTAITLSGANGNDLIDLDKLFCQYLRLVYTKNGITGGTIRATLCLKE